MVVVDRVVDMKRNTPTVVDGEGVFLFPAHWILWALALKNLSITMSMDAMRQGKPTQQRLADLLDEFELEGESTWKMYPYPLYTVDFSKREWVGYRILGDSRPNPLTCKVTLVRRIKGRELETEVPVVEPYLMRDGRILVASHADELRYNKYNETLFRSKLPLRLRRYTPLTGDGPKVAQPSAPVHKQQSSAIERALAAAEGLRR